MTRQNHCSAKFMAKEAFEAIPEQLMMADLAKKYDIDPIMITSWKRPAIRSMASASCRKNVAELTISDQKDEKLHARIGSSGWWNGTFFKSLASHSRH